MIRHYFHFVRSSVVVFFSLVSFCPILRVSITAVWYTCGRYENRKIRGIKRFSSRLNSVRIAECVAKYLDQSRGKVDARDRIPQ